MAAIVSLIQVLGNVLTLIIIADSLLSFVLPPYHPAREALGRILYPIYAPIRRVLPPVGMMDLTPLVVLILIQVLEAILIGAIRG